MTIDIQPFHRFDYVGATFNVYHANKGEGLPMHQHTWNHATVCHVGSCIVRIRGKEFTINCDSKPLDLPANVQHEIEALEDGTVFVNIFAEGKY